MNLQIHSQALTKQSHSNEVKAYFTQVLNLKKSGEKFPIDFDMVWPLIYSRKDKAVNELLNGKDEFGNYRYIKGIDYQSFHQMVQAGHTRSKKTIYKLSVEAMEWFIARKVRPVFNVYREVFHQTVEEKQKRKHNRLTVTRMVDILADIALIEDNQIRIALVEKLKSPTGYNRLTPTRLTELLADVCLVEEKELRLSLTNKLMGGRV